AVSTVMFTPDGKRIITGGGKSVRVWDTHSRKLLQRLEVDESVKTATLTHDGKRLGAWDGSRLFSRDVPGGLWPRNPDSREERLKVPDLRDSVALSPDLT